MGKGDSDMTHPEGHYFCNHCGGTIFIELCDIPQSPYPHGKDCHHCDNPVVMDTDMRLDALITAVQDLVEKLNEL